MSYSHLQTNVLAKFVDTACILFYTHSSYSLLYKGVTVTRAGFNL